VDTGRTARGQRHHLPRHGPRRGQPVHLSRSRDERGWRQRLLQRGLRHHADRAARRHQRLDRHDGHASQINLAWADNSSNETGFRVERRTGTAAFAAVVTAGANATAYADTGLAAGTTYEYHVVAVNAGGSSSASNTAAAATTSCAATPTPTPFGTGLLGEYFDNKDPTNLKFRRTDARVNFNWGSASPDFRVGRDTFSVRLTGQVVPIHSERYTF
jgi:hypothetical protein